MGEDSLEEDLGCGEGCGEFLAARTPGEGVVLVDARVGLLRPGAEPALGPPSLTSSVTRLGEGCTGRGGVLAAAADAGRLVLMLGDSPQSMTRSLPGLLASLRGLPGAGRL